MKLKRYYIDKIDGENVVLEGDEFHHLANVMRTREGENVELFCGDDYNYVATVAKLNKKNAELKIISKTKNIANPVQKIDLFQALAKGDKLSLIMQKITEIGASNMVVFESKFCDVKSNTGKLDKLESVSVSACKQCGRSKLTNVQGVMSFKDVVASVKKYDHFIVFYENEENLLLKDYLSAIKQNQNVAIVIGPEGGFSNEEIDALKSAGAKIVSLGKRILRTETAAILGVSVVSQYLE